jgi:Tol biopolymer transport system component
MVFSLVFPLVVGLFRLSPAQSSVKHNLWYSVDASPAHSQLFVANGDGSGEKPILPLTGLDYSPSLSRDGNWIVFTSERSGSADIYRVHRDGTGLERLTSDPAFDDQAALSPDGKTLAFVSSRKLGRAHVWLMDMVTRRTHLLAKEPGSGFHPAWSPDGKWLAFSSDRGRFAGHMPGRWEKTQSLSVYIVRSDGAGLRRITRGRGVAGSPQWSPDGKQVFYYETTEIGAVYSTFDSSRGATQITSIDVETGSMKAHTNGDGVRRWPQPLNDGSIAYLGTDEKRVVSLCQIKGETVTSGASGDIRSPSWSGDGKTVVYAKLTYGDKFAVLPGYTVLSDTRLTKLAYGGFFPVSSPSTGEIAVSSNMQSLVSMRPDGSGRKELLTTKDELLLSPTWSPDGRRIAFSKGLYFRPGGHPVGQIGIMDADGTNVHYHGTANTNCGFPSWSSDGKSIVYSQDAHLVVWNLETGIERNLTAPGGQRDTFPQWSPEGDWIVFSSDRDSDEDFKLFLIRSDGTGLHRLTDVSGDSHCSWSPNGDWIVFSSARMGFKDEHALSESPQPYGQLFMIRPDGSGLRQITDNKWEAGTAAWIKPVP